MHVYFYQTPLINSDSNSALQWLRLVLNLYFYQIPLTNSDLNSAVKRLRLVLSLYFGMSFPDVHCRIKLLDFNVEEAGCTEMLDFMSWCNIRFKIQICGEILVWTLPAGIKFLGEKIGGKCYWKQGHFLPLRSGEQSRLSGVRLSVGKLVTGVWVSEVTRPRACRTNVN